MEVFNNFSWWQILLVIFIICGVVVGVVVFAITKKYDFNLCGFKFTKPKKKDKTTKININKSNIDGGIVGGANNTIINNGISEKRVREILEEERPEAITNEEIDKLFK